jgi:transcription elongation factor GreA
MNLREYGLRIDEKLETEYREWKAEVSKLEKILEEQNAILRSDEAKGDRSENAVFQNAVDKKQECDSRIRMYNEMIENHAKAYEEYNTAKYTPTGKIKVGSVVSFIIEKVNKSYTVKIVPQGSAAPQMGAVSTNSPLGRELMGKQAGDVAACLTERGTWRYDIKEVY